MHAIHLKAPRLPKGPNLYFLSVAVFVFFCIAVAVLLISWLGGEAYAAQLGGLTSLGLAVLGMALSAIAAVLVKPDQ